ncbi:MAG: aryl-sulfate sulfotransferase, partial [Thermoanaerobaculia bacterium]|nr:aryl-sulfate sulfotransferase [Thermoanaerobaculia bacterium]
MRRSLLHAGIAVFVAAALPAVSGGTLIGKIPAASPAATTYTALQRATELQYWDPTRAESGYNFFGVGGTTYLLDMEGRVVHTWPIGTNPHLLPDGSVLDASTDDPSGFGTFKQVSWDGTTVWTYKETRSTYHPHHDFARIWNPKLKAYTTLFIANKDLTYAQLVAAGADPSRTPSSGAQIDAIVEVDASGTVVWEWFFFDHVVQDYDASKPNHVGTGKTVSDYPGKLNINLPGHNLKNDWLHCNSLDYNSTLDRVVINSVQGEFYVIDHGGTFVAGDPVASIAKAATSAGDFLYRFGDPVRYGQGEKPAILEDWTLSTTGTKQLGGSHNIQWIPDGLPGAGHFLIFNNAEYLSEHTAQSYVMEINPYLDANGNDTGAYVNPPAAGYVTTSPPAVTDKTPRKISRQVVWSYSTKSSLTLFATIGSGAQRLPNGNTLVCGDNDGYVSEVTPAGAVVWEYIVPVTKSGKLLVLGDRIPMTNSIFRAYRYLASDPALAGRTLTAGATIAGRTKVENPYAGDAAYKALQRPTETQYWDSANAYNGYTLFAAQGRTYLIDMQGRVARSWTGGTDPQLLESGHVLDWATNSSGAVGLRERDWDGNTVWEHFETRTAYHPHGDFRRIWDPKLGAYATIYLANRDVTAALCLAAGCDPADGPYDGAQVDTVVEVDMSGNVVWEWSFWDHAVQTIDASKANYAGAGKKVSDFPGRIDLNLPGRPLRANWLDCNSLDYNQALDQILVNSRQGEFYVIDRGNTFVAGDPAASLAKAASLTGDFLYRFGDPARYSQGNPPSVGTNWETATSGNKQIGGSSDAQWIATGLPGAGHILVFNNNQYLYQRTPQSYVFEVNPFAGSAGTDTGAYVNPPAAGYTTWTFDKDTMKANQQLSKQVVWKYGSLSNLTLFSHFGSSAQRLPNGNTLICATTEGYLVEVDASGNVVWEYINPVTDSGIASSIGDDLPMTNAVPRARRYAATFSGFSGHDLTATKTIVEGAVPTAAFTFSPSAPRAGETVTFTDSSGNGPTGWSWNFGDNGTSTLQNPSHAFAAAGTYAVTLTATNASGSDSTSKVVTVSSAGGTSVTRFLPIVLDVTGRARYVSELTLANRGTTEAAVTLTYTAASTFGDTGSGPVSLTLAAGRQLVVDDAIAYLRTKGLAIPTGNQGGTLRAAFENLSSSEAAYAGVR